MVQIWTCRDEIIALTKAINHSQGLDHHVETTEFDSIGHHVKKGKRGACKQKAATVLPDRTAAT